jgi:hypothetical protein
MNVSSAKIETVEKGVCTANLDLTKSTLVEVNMAKYKLAPVRDSDKTRFKSKTRINPAKVCLGSACIEWQGSTNNYGYGAFALGGQNVKAHRFAFRISRGHWPITNALHHCDNRRCVNPEHLYDGNQSDNVRDMIHRGRMVRAYGSTHPSSRFTAGELEEVRKIAKSGHYSIRALGRAYGVSSTTICSIKNDKQRVRG